MMELSQGSALGQYVILDRLGRGATSTVYRAHHPALDREVAIKVLWSPLADDFEFQERFRREARSVSRLRHPNVLAVYDFGSHGGTTYMVMELLPGGTLADRLTGPLSISEAQRILTAVAAALDHAHASGVIHRDVKPTNILFTRDDEPVLSDFGIARLADAGGYAATGGGVKGTPTYMSPEQAAGGEVSSVSDLYSLGVVLYEMLAGRPPFQGDNWVTLMRSHAEEDPPHARSVNRSLSSAVDAVLVRALSKEPGDRYQSGAALVDAFVEAAPVEDEQPTPLSIPILIAPPDDDVLGITTIETGDESPTVETPLPPLEPPRPLAPAPVQPTRSFAPLALLLAILVLAMVTGALLGIAIWERQYGPFWGSPTAVPLPTPTSAAPAQAQSQPQQPVIPPPQAQPPQQQPAASPPPPPTQAVAGAPKPGSSPEPIPPSQLPVLQPTGQQTQGAAPSGQRGPLAVEMLSPVNGDQVPARPLIRGRRSGLQGPDEHLWLLVHPQGAENLWWPYQRELIADSTGVWEVRDAEIGGQPGSQHDLLVGVVDAAGHRALVRQVDERPGEPLNTGFPPSFRPLARIIVVKGAG